MATSVTITGSGTPGPVIDRASPGVLVRHDGLNLQFDAGRAPSMRRAAGRETGPPAEIGLRRRPRSRTQFIDAQMSSSPSYSLGTTVVSIIDSQSGSSSKTPRLTRLCISAPSADTLN